MSWGEDLSIVPPQGWYYDEEKSGFRFVANTLGQLSDKVREHRLANNFPLGDPRAEILAWTHARLADSREP